jgi:hypothetical protein
MKCGGQVISGAKAGGLGHLGLQGSLHQSFEASRRSGLEMMDNEHSHRAVIHIISDHNASKRKSA